MSNALTGVAACSMSRTHSAEMKPTPSPRFMIARSMKRRDGISASAVPCSSLAALDEPRITVGHFVGGSSSSCALLGAGVVGDWLSSGISQLTGGITFAPVSFRLPRNQGLFVGIMTMPFSILRAAHCGRGELLLMSRSHELLEMTGDGRPTRYLLQPSQRVVWLLCVSVHSDNPRGRLDSRSGNPGIPRWSGRRFRKSTWNRRAPGHLQRLWHLGLENRNRGCSPG
jgi:hypothetical protein